MTDEQPGHPLSPAERVNAEVSNQTLEGLHQALAEAGITHAQAVATAAALCADTIATSVGTLTMKELVLLEVQDFMLARMYQAIAALTGAPPDAN